MVSLPTSGRKTVPEIQAIKQASFVAQLVNNPPAVWETWVRSLGWEDPLEKEKATSSLVLSWPGEFHGLDSPWGLKESDTIYQFSLSIELTIY